MNDEAKSCQLWLKSQRSVVLFDLGYCIWRKILLGFSLVWQGDIYWILYLKLITLLVLVTIFCRIPAGRKSPLRDRTLSLDLSLDRRLPLDAGSRHLSMDLANSYPVTGSNGVNGRLVNIQEVEPKAPKVDKVREPRYQNGVLRTNCIDCLDRTNVAQYAYGLEALGRQLQALGLTDSPKIDPDSGVAAALMDMFQNMGDCLALQYGGSEAHNYVWPSFI